MCTNARSYSSVIHRSRTLLLLVLLAAGVGAGIYLGAGVYYSRASENCANIGCSGQVISQVRISNHYNSSVDGYIHFPITNLGSSPITLTDIFIDNSLVNYTLSSSSGTGSGCSESTRVLGPSANCVVNALSPNLGSTTHSLVVVTSLGAKFYENINGI